MTVVPEWEFDCECCHGLEAHAVPLGFQPFSGGGR